MEFKVSFTDDDEHGVGADTDFERKVNIVLNLWIVNPYHTMACKRMDLNYPNDKWEWRIVVVKVEGKTQYQPSRRYIVFEVHQKFKKKVEWLFDAQQSEEEGKCCFYDFDIVARFNGEGKLNPEKWKHLKRHL